MHIGVLDEAMLASGRITHQGLMAAVPQAGVSNLANVQVVIPGTNGRINVIAKGAPAP